MLRQNTDRNHEIATHYNLNRKGQPYRLAFSLLCKTFFIDSGKKNENQGQACDSAILNNPVFRTPGHDV